MKKENKQIKKWKAMTIVFGTLAGLGLAASIAAPIIITNQKSQPKEDGDIVTITFTGDAENATIVSKYGEKAKLNQDFVFYVFPNEESLIVQSVTIGNKQLTITNGNEVLIPGSLMNSKNITVKITLGSPMVQLTDDSAEGVTIGEAPIVLGQELRIPVSIAPGMSITDIMVYKDNQYFKSARYDADAIGTINNADGSLCILIPGSYVTTYDIKLCVITESFVGPVEPISGESKIININENSLKTEGQTLNFDAKISSNVILEDETVPTFEITNKLSDSLNGVFFFTQQGSFAPIDWSIKKFTIGGGKTESFQPTIDWTKVTQMEQTYVPHFYVKQTLSGFEYNPEITFGRSYCSMLEQTNPYTIYNFSVTLTKSLFESEVYKSARNNFNGFQVSYMTFDKNGGGFAKNVCPFTIINKSENLENWTMNNLNTKLEAGEGSEFYCSDEDQTISIDFILNDTIDTAIDYPMFELLTARDDECDKTRLVTISFLSAPEDMNISGYYGVDHNEEAKSSDDTFISKTATEITPEFSFLSDKTGKYIFKFTDNNSSAVVTQEVEITSELSIFTVKPNFKDFKIKDDGTIDVSLEIEDTTKKAYINPQTPAEEGFGPTIGGNIEIKSSSTSAVLQSIRTSRTDYPYGHFVIKNSNGEIVASTTESQTYNSINTYQLSFNNLDWTKINKDEVLQLHFVEDTVPSTEITLDGDTGHGARYSKQLTDIEYWNKQKVTVTIPLSSDEGKGKINHVKFLSDEAHEWWVSCDLLEDSIKVRWENEDGSEIKEVASENIEIKDDAGWSPYIVFAKDTEVSSKTDGKIIVEFDWMCLQDEEVYVCADYMGE